MGKDFVNQLFCPPMSALWTLEEHDIETSAGTGTHKTWEDMDDMCGLCKRGCQPSQYWPRV